MESQQVLANLPELSFQSANSSKDNILLSISFVNCKSPVGEWMLFKVLIVMHFLFHRELQENLVRSHSAGNKSNLIGWDFKGLLTRCFRVFCVYACITDLMLSCAGVGNPLSPERTRMLLALRINVLAKGHSGISLETLHAMIQAFNGKPQLDPTASLYLSWTISFSKMRYCWYLPLGISFGEADCHMTNFNL